MKTGIGIGMDGEVTTVIMPSDEPSWCEKHECQCPCHEDSNTPKENMILALGLLFILFLIAQGGLGFIGMLEGFGTNWAEKCAYDIKGKYIFPLYPVGCRAGQWLGGK